MGIFDSLFGSGDILGNIIHDENPNIKIQKEVINYAKQHRKEIEDRAEDINPTYGKVVRGLNNLNDTLENAQDSINNGVLRALFSSEVKSLDLADHLFVQRVGYTHHGLYVGDGKVIHYLQECIREDSLETFADGARIHKKSIDDSPISYSKKECINRAYRRFREDKYNLLTNNCENFVRWCRSGGTNY
ncbi:lecithin retinol acyltransferase family protein [Clostridium butyricum]|uniref:lecithin retinol acyltransferase family protein n=1 Tax=Clostridium butyricum TaxID=1492 RepID=UPI0018A94EFF|nr:lecithin retinol acyltransferase family protein [Clostridium butyricum]